MLAGGGAGVELADFVLPQAVCTATEQGQLRMQLELVVPNFTIRATPVRAPVPVSWVLMGVIAGAMHAHQPCLSAADPAGACMRPSCTYLPQGTYAQGNRAAGHWKSWQYSNWLFDDGQYASPGAPDGHRPQGPCCAGFACLSASLPPCLPARLTWAALRCLTSRWWGHGSQGWTAHARRSAPHSPVCLLSAVALQAYTWAVCRHFLHTTVLRERVFTPYGGFMLVTPPPPLPHHCPIRTELYGRQLVFPKSGDRGPEFFECRVEEGTVDHVCCSAELSHGAVHDLAAPLKAELHLPTTAREVLPVARRHPEMPPNLELEELQAAQKGASKPFIPVEAPAAPVHRDTSQLAKQHEEEVSRLEQAHGARRVAWQEEREEQERGYTEAAVGVAQARHGAATVVAGSMAEDVPYAAVCETPREEARPVTMWPRPHPSPPRCRSPARSTLPSQRAKGMPPTSILPPACMGVQEAAEAVQDQHDEELLSGHDQIVAAYQRPATTSFTVPALQASIRECGT